MYPLPALNADLKQYQCDSTSGLKRKYNEIRPEYVQNSKRIKSDSVNNILLPEINISNTTTTTPLNITTTTPTPTQEKTVSAATLSIYPRPVKNKEALRQKIKAEAATLPPEDVIIATVKAFQKVSLTELRTYFHSFGYNMTSAALYKKCMALAGKNLLSKQVESGVLVLHPKIQYNLNNLTTMTTPSNITTTTSPTQKTSIPTAEIVLSSESGKTLAPIGNKTSLPSTEIILAAVNKRMNIKELEKYFEATNYTNITSNHFFEKCYHLVLSGKLLGEPTSDGYFLSPM